MENKKNQETLKKHTTIVNIFLQPLVPTHLPLLILQSPSQNKKTSLHTKKNPIFIF
jgi:hypothetical protein